MAAQITSLAGRLFILFFFFYVNVSRSFSVFAALRSSCYSSYSTSLYLYICRPVSPAVTFLSSLAGPSFSVTPNGPLSSLNSF